MLKVFSHFAFAALAAAVSLTTARAELALPRSPAGVMTLAPADAIKPTGTWNLGTRAGEFVYIAGMRGIDPKTNTLVAGDEPVSCRASSI
jgi:2-iminobutanoate/2-iminopropanoate deaminase